MRLSLNVLRDLGKQQGWMRRKRRERPPPMWDSHEKEPSHKALLSWYLPQRGSNTGLAPGAHCAVGTVKRKREGGTERDSLFSLTVGYSQVFLDLNAPLSILPVCIHCNRS